jgi:hypothetical protein
MDDGLSTVYRSRVHIYSEDVTVSTKFVNNWLMLVLSAALIGRISRYGTQLMASC